MSFNEFTTGCDAIAHQHCKDSISLSGILNLNFFERSTLWIQWWYPTAAEASFPLIP